MSMAVWRYGALALFMAALIVPVAALEALFIATGSGLSVRDSRGPGQVSLYLLLIIGVTAFSVFVARERVDSFVGMYASRWRRALKGFFAMWLLATAIVSAGYAVFAAMGYVRPAALEVSAHMVERTLVAMLVMLVLVLTEELIFRSVVTRYLRWNTSRSVTIAAILVSSLIFAAAHNVTDYVPWTDPAQMRLFTGLFCLGVLLATTYIVTGSLTCAMGIHAGFLGSKVFLRKTPALELDTNVWFLGYSDDLRMAPAVWLLFLGTALIVYLMRNRLHDALSIERPVASLNSRPFWQRKEATGTPGDSLPRPG